MQLSRFLFGLAWLLLPVALAGTTWLYLYPLFHGCAFPQPSSTSLPLASSRAPFRLLALGDPQLEGDSSLPDPRAPVFPSLQHVLADLRHANYDPPDVRAILLAAASGAARDLGAWLEGHRKTVDLWGNDWYLAHIVRSLRWWTEPTHIAVLGDLLGSQWVTDGEFEKRAARYWGTVMRGLARVPDATMGVHVASDHYDDPEPARARTWGGTTEALGEDPAWAKRVINIAGNHDIGYAGDIDNARVARFERAFGSVNWDLWLTLPSNTSTETETDPHNTTSPPPNTSTETGPRDATSPPPALRLVVLNTMNLDTPAYTESLQQDTYAFLNHIIATSRPVSDKSHATILLTHIPLHKAPGICADSPYFDFFEGGHGVREQNMLSEHGSRIVLESVFGLNSDVHAEGAGMGRRGLVVNGHDHEGCDVLHWIRQPAAASHCSADEVEKGDAYWPAHTWTQRGNASATAHLPADVAAANETDTSPLEQSGPAPQHQEEDGWTAHPFPPRPYAISPSQHCTHIPRTPHLREITLRSIMGDYSGYAGFLSAWYDSARGERGEWVIEFSSCGVGVQHWWWAVHIVDLLLLLALAGGLAAQGYERVRVRVRARARGTGGEQAGKGRGETQQHAGAQTVRQSKTVVNISVQPGARRLGDARTT
ncbi:hypothetical protein SVAN01_11375 [Stagonosporopsis vannaccii]|nr:hypothetical protein SVAN01_11375 [Stagonosporopsis vannaccii]